MQQEASLADLRWPNTKRVLLLMQISTCTAIILFTLTCSSVAKLMADLNHDLGTKTHLGSLRHAGDSSRVKGLIDSTACLTCSSVAKLMADLNHDLGTKTHLGSLRHAGDSSRVKGLMIPNLLPGGRKYFADSSE